MRILVVDDSLIARKLIIRILKAANHEVVEADSGYKAIMEYKKNRPDAVMMDLDMPVMNGFEAAKLIMNSDPTAKIVMVSAHEQNDLFEMAAANGIKYIVNKPVDDTKINSIIQRISEDIRKNSSALG